VSYWSGEGNANDSANSHHGTLINGATFTPAGQAGQAFSLNGVNAFIQVPDSPDWAFGNNDFTIALWINFDTIRIANANSLPNVFIGQDEGGGPTNKWVFYSDGTDLNFHINGGVGQAFLGVAASFTPIQWYHVAVTRTGNTYTFYVDGASVGTVIDHRAIPDVNAPLTIGQAEGLGFFNGRLDEIQIYNRALSQNEIQAITTVPEPSTVVLCSVAFIVVFGPVLYRGTTSNSINSV